LLEAYPLDDRGAYSVHRMPDAASRSRLPALAIPRNHWFQTAGQRDGGGGGATSHPANELRDELKGWMRTRWHIDEAIFISARRRIGPRESQAKVYLRTSWRRQLRLEWIRRRLKSAAGHRPLSRGSGQVPYDVKSMKQIVGIEFSIKKLDDAKPGRRRWQQIRRMPRRPMWSRDRWDGGASERTRCAPAAASKTTARARQGAARRWRPSRRRMARWSRKALQYLSQAWRRPN